MYQSGQIIKAKARVPFLYHYAIILNWQGQSYVLHNTPAKNVVMEPLNKFLKEREIINVFNSDLMLVSDQEILNRFKNICHKKYSLLYNCEHFIYNMLHCPLESKQLQEWTSFAVIVAATSIIIYSTQ